MAKKPDPTPEVVVPLMEGVGVVVDPPQPSLFSRLGAMAKTFLHPVASLFEARSFWIMGVVLFMLWWWDAAWLKTLLQFSLSGVALVGMAHWIRKVLAPNIDIQAAANKAMEHWCGAAIVFAVSVIFILVVMIYLSSAGSIKP